MTFGVAKDTLYSTLATGVSFSVSLITSILVARELGPSTLGIYSLLIWFRTIVGTIIDFGFSNAIARYWPELAGKGYLTSAKSIASRLFLFQITIAIICLIIIIEANTAIAWFLDEPEISRYIPIAAISLAISVMVTFLRAFTAGTRKFWARMVADILSSLTMIAAIIFLLIRDDLTIINLLYADIAIGTLQLILFLLILRPNLSFNKATIFTHERKLGLVKYCTGVFIFTTLYGLLMQRTETFFIARFHTSDQIAFFNLAHNIAMSLLVVFPASLATAVMPTLANLHGKNEVKSMELTFANSLRLLALLAFPISIGGATIAPLLVKLIYGSEYAPAGSVLRILMIGALFSSMVAMIIPIFWVFGEPFLATLWLLPNSIFTLVISYVLISKAAAIGAAMSNAIVQLFLCTSGFIIISYRYKFSFPIKQIVKIGVSAAGVATIALLCIQILNSTSGLIIGVLVASAFYIPALFLSRAITVGDLNTLDHIISTLPERLNKFLLLLTFHARAYASGGQNAPR